MSEFLPDPVRLSLGSLEEEVVDILWVTSGSTARDVLDQILDDPNRELTQASVLTVLKRLEQKGWVQRQRSGRVSYWHVTVSRERAKALQAYEHLNRFMAISNSDMVAAFANELDSVSLDRIESLAEQIHQLKQLRRGQP
ncbi:MAG: BlaI/MecI/CopY family transcriptional regulator [Cyanophyceae cyanobacterium]|mgnify:CR=1 FL=1